MYKAALVLQGGAMRGVYTSGVLDVLIDNVLELEAVYGISAGAKNSQYYISKQRGEAIKVDLFCMNNRKSISLRNLIFEDGVISADYYNNYIMKELAPLNENFNLSTQKYYIGATNCLTGEIHYFEKSNCDLRKAIVASCSMPLAQSMAIIDDVPYLDGGISEAIPLEKAILDGYDKIVVVLTREKGYRAKEDKDDRFQSLYKIRYKNYPKLLEKLLTQNSRYNELIEKIEKMEEEGKIFCIYPSTSPDVSILEKDKEKVVRLYNMGKKDMLDNLDKLVEYLNK